MSAPARKIRSQIKFAAFLLLLFLITISVLSVWFLLLPMIRFQVISPLAKVLSAKSAITQVPEIKDLCQKNDLSCNNIVVHSDGSIRMTIDNGTVVYLSGQKDLASQLASLQQVVSQLTIKGKQLKSVDFRFAQVVVSF